MVWNEIPLPAFPMTAVSRAEIYCEPPGFQSPRGQETFCKSHRVGRVLSFFSSRRNWDSPAPLAAGERAPPHPLVRGGGHTPLRLKGWGSSNSDEGT